MSTVALVTDEASLPIDYDMPLLLDACRAVGLTAKVCSWEDETIDWSRFDAALLRSPWTWVGRLPVFLAWCERIAASTRLLNPLSVARWGLDKLYLADLVAHGVPIVPSKFIEPGANPIPALQELLAEHPQTGEIVVKPTTAAYSKDVRRFTLPLEAEAYQHIVRLLGEGSHVILQPYVQSVDHGSETDLIYFDGVYSHAIHKSAMLMPDGTVNVPTLEHRKARTAAEDERAVASAALAAAASHLGLEPPLLYGRVDLIRDSDGRPMVLEMEICEPSLNLPFSESGAMRFAHALDKRLKS
ncbi:hypothetical protein [Streptosporangium sp. NPDC051022]|uniref:ATP-grasp domain-containing protein n=1 Tax=Streptosporangium sp. NPDC051022 TaxID=3155752 RepID=UPI003414447F